MIGEWESVAIDLAESSGDRSLASILLRKTSGYGDGNGCGYGDGNGCGYGDGNGCGDGSGDGNGDGDGDGDG